jgi:glycosyltransferase involved in cell wall biosynthesis
MKESLRILHCANFSESKYGQVFYSIDRKISNGLIRNGHFVYDFSYREIAKNLAFFKRKKLGAKKMNEKLIQTVQNIQPNLLLLGHSELVYSDTLRFIRENYPTIKIAMWWVDPFDKIDHIDERLPYLDAFFATTSPEYYKHKFLNKTNFYFLPNICDNSIETLKSYESDNFDYDLIFIGRKDEKRKDFIEKLTNLEKLDFKIFGDTKDNLIFGQNFLNTISKSRMTINYSRYNDIPLYSSDRIIQLLAQGTLVFCPRIPEFESLFSDNEIVYFNDFSDLEKKIYYFKKNDKERIEISKNACERAHKEFNSTIVTKFMLKLVFPVDYLEDSYLIKGKV